MVQVKRTLNQIIAGILVNSIYEMKNYPIVLINTVLSPLSFLILIVFVSRGSLLGDAIVGGFIMSMFSNGIALQGDLSHLKNDFKLQEMVVSSPASAGAYVTGMAISELIYSSPALAVLVALAILYLHGTLIQGLLFCGVLATMFLTSIALGFTLATMSSDIVQSFAFSRLISTLFSTLPPVYYPITLIPHPFQYLAYLSPTTYAAQIAQNALGYLPISAHTAALDWAVLLSVTMVLFLIAVKKARWREA
ncbi:MAG: ABC transporter permease [Nitrososphaerota archaeon]|nr:ABC transporter permease [Nitrososphaerota archaeon]